MFDLGPAADEMSRLVRGVRDDQLTAPTPCTDWTVADLLAHVHQFATVFTDNAHKAPTQPPTTLVDGWRRQIPAQLDALGHAWREESAWQGRVSAGGIEMDAADNAVVGIEELTVHGWDLARATGGSLRATEDALDGVDRFFELFGSEITRGQGGFGPAVAASGDATRLDRAVAQAGRDPRWRAR